MHLMNRTRQLHLGVLVLLLLTVFLGCRVTDHSEKEVSSGDLRFPRSGYEDVDPGDLPAITFEQTHMDMGSIVQGTKVTRQFTFKNTGGSPLVLSDVRGSCGCTVGKEWPKHPIAPGQKGTLDVVFDSEGRSGRQDKTVTVVANTSPPTTLLTITGEVIGPTNIKPIE
jgi:hypothetical protein